MLVCGVDSASRSPEFDNPDEVLADLHALLLYLVLGPFNCTYVLQSSQQSAWVYACSYKTWWQTANKQQTEE